LERGGKLATMCHMTPPPWTYCTAVTDPVTKI
jgi:hypothetical protein